MPANDPKPAGRPKAPAFWLVRRTAQARGGTPARGPQLEKAPTAGGLALAPACQAGCGRWRGTAALPSGLVRELRSYRDSKSASTTPGGIDFENGAYTQLRVPSAAMTRGARFPVGQYTWCRSNVVYRCRGRQAAMGSNRRAARRLGSPTRRGASITTLV